MSWTHARFEHNDDKTTNDSICTECGQRAGAHLPSSTDPTHWVFNKCPDDLTKPSPAMVDRGNGPGED